MSMRGEISLFVCWVTDGLSRPMPFQHTANAFCRFLILVLPSGDLLEVSINYNVAMTFINNNNNNNG